jgi:hypothetical protein
MEYFARLDVSLRSCALCIVDTKGTVIPEGPSKVSSGPRTMLAGRSAQAGMPQRRVKTLSPSRTIEFLELKIDYLKAHMILSVRNGRLSTTSETLWTVSDKLSMTCKSSAKKRLLPSVADGAVVAPPAQ